VTDDFLANLLQQCQNLVCLDISGKSQIYLHACIYICLFINRLSFCLIGCSGVGNKVLKAISTLQKLKELRFDCLERITDEDLKYICGLKELKSFYAWDCRLITNNGASLLIKSLPQLRILNLTGCNISANVINVIKLLYNGRFSNMEKIPIKLIFDAENDNTLLLVQTSDLHNKDILSLMQMARLHGNDNNDNDDSNDDDNDDDDNKIQPFVSLQCQNKRRRRRRRRRRNSVSFN